MQTELLYVPRDTDSSTPSSGQWNSLQKLVSVTDCNSPSYTRLRSALLHLTFKGNTRTLPKQPATQNKLNKALGNKLRAHVGIYLTLGVARIINIHWMLFLTRKELCNCSCAFPLFTVLNYIKPK